MQSLTAVRWYAAAETDVEMLARAARLGNRVEQAEMEKAQSEAQAEARGSADACLDLGMAYSCGTGGVAIDFIEAHKWFNIAASKGHEEASWCRADVADEMTAREIAEAQRRAREWLAEGQRHAA